MKGGEVKVDKIEELLEYNKKILQELAEAKQKIEQLENKVRQITLEKAAISENYQALRKKVYGRSSEKSSYVDYANSPFQLSLFPEEEPKNLMVQLEEKNAKKKFVPRRKTGYKAAQLKNMEKQTIVHTLSESEKRCEKCSGEMKTITEAYVRTEMIVIPRMVLAIAWNPEVICIADLSSGGLSNKCVFFRAQRRRFRTVISSPSGATNTQTLAS